MKNRRCKRFIPNGKECANSQDDTSWKSLAAPVLPGHFFFCFSKINRRGELATFGCGLDAALPEGLAPEKTSQKPSPDPSQKNLIERLL